MGNFKKHLTTIMKHRRYVRRACFKMGIPWQGLVHDLDFIHSFADDDKAWFGAYLNYADTDHKTTRFTFRGDEIKVYDVTDWIDNIIEDCKRRLSVLFSESKDGE